MRIIIAIICMHLFSINPSWAENKHAHHSVDSHNSRIALDWSGQYSGVIPCADCSGIKVDILLKNNNTYSKTTSYLGKENSIFHQAGKFEWDKSGGIIEIDGVKYRVGEEALFQLDSTGNKISGKLANRYTIHKIKDLSLAVQSRYLVAWVYDKTMRFQSPLFADEFVWG